MTDHESLLLALEAEPADDLAWLAYADWLEERGDVLSAEIRANVESRKWSNFRYTQFMRLSRRQRRLFACDCVERVLPLFERCYPNDQGPREFIEILRRYATGKRVEAAAQVAQVSFRLASEDASRDPHQYSAAYRAAGIAYYLGEEKLPPRFSLSCLNAVYVMVADRFGPEVHQTPHGQFKPEWAALREWEFRWQLARLLRYRYGFLGGQDEA